MKIVIDIRCTLKQKTGIGYYTLNLINHLAHIDRGNRYALYSQIGFFSRNKHVPRIPGKNFKHMINRFSRNPCGFLKRGAVLHTSAFDLPKPKKTKLVLVVHDVIHKAYPAGHSQEVIESTDRNLRRILPEADRIIVDSQTTAQDIVKFYDVDKAKIRLIYPGVNDDLALEAPGISAAHIVKEFSLTTPYILYVGTLEPRKNVEGLVRAFHLCKHEFKIPHTLVICGMKGWGYDRIFTLVTELGLEKDIVFTGYVRRQQLCALYQCAEMFVYPSLYEGCGLPVLEAFSFGLPVVTSNVSSTFEIAEDAAMVVDPYSYPAIAWALMRLVKDYNLQKLLRRKALERAKQFSWEQSALQTLQVMNECAG